MLNSLLAQIASITLEEYKMWAKLIDNVSKTTKTKISKFTPNQHAGDCNCVSFASFIRFIAGLNPAVFYIWLLFIHSK